MCRGHHCLLSIFLHLQHYDSTLYFAADLLPAATASQELLVLEAGQSLSCCKLAHQQVLSQRWARNMQPVPYHPSLAAGSTRDDV
jgi:hypothetical protein